MANLSNLDRVFKLKPGESVTVGNNRRIERLALQDGAGDRFNCYLHGSPVARIICNGAGGIAFVKLDACGYLTTTTIAAMRDFMGAFGVAGSASRAGGILSARWVHDGAWHERDSVDGESLSFAADRYPVLA
jgi:hypothetical protein